MSMDPNLQDVADGYMANRATMPMALVRCIQATYRRCQDEAKKASDLRSHNYDGPLRQEAREVEAIIHDAKYHVLCEMLGDQSRLMDNGFLHQRPECGCPEVYAKLDHKSLGTSVAPEPGKPWPTICQNPDCPGDKET